MDWSKIGSMVADAAPALGALLAPVTGGASIAVGGLISSVLGTENKPEAIAKAIQANPELALKLKELDAKIAGMNHDEKMALLKFDETVISKVNDTMQVEAQSEHWQTYSWRPFIGFSFGLYIISLWALPFFGKTPTVLSPDAVMAVGAILGVASWHRGKMQHQKEVNKNG